VLPNLPQGSFGDTASPRGPVCVAAAGDRIRHLSSSIFPAAASGYALGIQTEADRADLAKKLAGLHLPCDLIRLDIQAPAQVL